jgi:Lon protease-like protein
MSSAPPRDRTPDSAAALASLPVFPLPQTVLFPGALLPLYVFEPRYRALVKDCLATHQTMAIALIGETGQRGPDGRTIIETVAGLGVVVDHVLLPDGRYNILVCGRSRVRLEELPFVPPYRTARAQVLEPLATEVLPQDTTALLASAAAFAADIRARDPEFDFRIPPHVGAGAAADLAAHHLVLDARERQSLLEELDVAARVRRTTEALALQHAALTRAAVGPVN